MSLTSGWDFIDSAGIRYIWGRTTQAAVSGSRGGWQNNALHRCVLVYLREALQALCLPKALFTMAVILLHDLPVDTTAWTLPSVKHPLAGWLHW